MEYSRDESLWLVAHRFFVLSDPTRLRLLLALEHQPRCVQELADLLEIEHRTASRGLNLLHEDGLLARRRERGTVVYSLADFTACRLVARARESVRAHIEELGDLIGD